MAQIVKPKEEGGVGVSRASNSKAILAFKSFADELRDYLNDSITDTGLAHFQRAYPAQDEGCQRQERER